MYDLYLLKTIKFKRTFIRFLFVFWVSAFIYDIVDMLLDSRYLYRTNLNMSFNIFIICMGALIKFYQLISIFFLFIKNPFFIPDHLSSFVWFNKDYNCFINCEVFSGKKLKLPEMVYGSIPLCKKQISSHHLLLHLSFLCLGHASCHGIFLKLTIFTVLIFLQNVQFEKKVLKKTKCENVTTELDQIFKNKFCILWTQTKLSSFFC